MAKNGWKLSKVAITGSTRSLLAKNGRKWVLTNQILPTTLSVAIVFRVHPFLAKTHRELSFLAIVLVLTVLSETEVVAYLGHSSLNPELSQFIVPKLIWPSSGTFQHHHQLSTSEDTASCLLGRLDTHQRASLCGQLEFVSRTSLTWGAVEGRLRLTKKTRHETAINLGNCDQDNALRRQWGGEMLLRVHVNLSRKLM